MEPRAESNNFTLKSRSDRPDQIISLQFGLIIFPGFVERLLQILKQEEVSHGYLGPITWQQ